MNDDPEALDASAVLDPKRWAALAVLLTGSFLTAFDFFVVNVALPAMHTELGARPQDLEMVVAGYGLAFAVLLITGGRLGDLYGRKRLFMIGMAGFTVSSALCGLAASPAMLIASRVLQGLTAALMSPQVLAIIRVTFGEHERGRAIGYVGTTLGIASIVAQLVGGALVQADFAGLGWRPIFLVNVPVGVVALGFAQTTLRQSRTDERPRLDLGGIVLVTLALGLLTYPLVEGQHLGWPLWALLSLAAAGPALAAFVLYEWLVLTSGRSPLVNLRLFRVRAFSLGLVMAVSFFAGVSSFYMGITIFLQQGFSFSPLAAGLVFVAFGVGFVAGSLASSHVARRIGPCAISLGTALMGSGLLGVVALARTAHGMPISLAALWPLLIWYGCGQGIAMPTLVASVIGSDRIPARDAGAASGVFSMVQQASFALGVTVIMGLFFKVLGQAAGPADYERALSVVLTTNASLLALTGGLAFLLPSRAPVAGVAVHLE